MAKVIYINPMGDDLVTAFADRLCELIKESDDPPAEMITIEERLEEEGLWYGAYLSPATPEHFVFNVVEENPYMRETIVAARVIYTPKRIETIGDLLSLPSFR